MVQSTEGADILNDIELAKVRRLHDMLDRYPNSVRILEDLIDGDAEKLAKMIARRETIRQIWSVITIAVKWSTGFIALIVAYKSLVNGGVGK